MEENIISEKKGNAWLWIIIILIIAIVVLFFLFRSPSPEKEKPGSGADGGEGSGGGAEGDELEALDIGENPDVGVDDFSSLEVSSEEITG